MKTDTLVSLHKNCGYSISRVGDYYFYSRKMDKSCSPLKRIFPLRTSFPDNYQIDLDDKLVNSLKWSGLITSVLIDSPKKCISEYVLTTDHYDLERFDRKVRNRIKKSIHTCTFRRPGLEELLHEGLQINQQTLNRQSREDAMLSDPKKWAGYIKSIYTNSEFIILGAYFQDRLIGYLIVYELEGKFNMLHAFIDRTDSAETNPMCGLIYTMVNLLIKKYGRITISYGLHRYQVSWALTRFKQKMLFERIPVSKGNILHPVLLLWIKLIIFVTIGVLRRKNVKSELVRACVILYQGHRRVQAVLKRHKQPGYQVELARELSISA